MEEHCRAANAPRFHFQPNFNGKEAYSGFQVTLETKPMPVPGTASTPVPASISHWCWFCSYVGTSLRLLP